MSELSNNNINTDIMILACDGANPNQISDLKRKLSLPVVEQKDTTNEELLYLEVSKDGLSLTQNSLRYHGDYSHLVPRLKSNNLNTELLVKAAKIKGIGPHPTAIDATAGLGEDSVLLAASGYEVTLYEANPIIAELLKDTIKRAMENPSLCQAVSRMKVIEGDSVAAMKSGIESPDLILLDPMFPERQKSGLVHKKFQLIHNLELPCDIEKEMIEAAIQLKPQRIVIKRPLKGPYLGDIKPSYSLTGKAIRYDCIAIPRQKEEV